MNLPHDLRSQSRTQYQVMIIWIVCTVLMLLIEILLGIAVAEHRMPALVGYLLTMVLPFIRFALSVAGFTLFMMWVHRANLNLQAMPQARLPWDDGMVVGAFFIPVVNLFMPYQILAHLFQASDPAYDVPPNKYTWRSASPPNTLFGWWLGFWACILMANPLTQVWLRKVMGIYGLHYFNIFLYLLEIFVWAALFTMLHWLEDAQERKWTLYEKAGALPEMGAPLPLSPNQAPPPLQQPGIADDDFFKI